MSTAASRQLSMAAPRGMTGQQRYVALLVRGMISVLTSTAILARIRHDEPTGPITGRHRFPCTFTSAERKRHEGGDALGYDV